MKCKSLAYQLGAEFVDDGGGTGRSAIRGSSGLDGWGDGGTVRGGRDRVGAIDEGMDVMGMEPSRLRVLLHGRMRRWHQ